MLLENGFRHRQLVNQPCADVVEFAEGGGLCVEGLNGEGGKSNLKENLWMFGCSPEEIIKSADMDMRHIPLRNNSSRLAGIARLPYISRAYSPPRLLILLLKN